MAFAITEPDAGTNTHNITTSVRKDGDEWVLSGQKIWISGVDEAENVLVVARTEDAKSGKVKLVPMVVPTDSAGMEYHHIRWRWSRPREAVLGVLRRRPAARSDALLGDENGGLAQLFAGLNPERIMAASFSQRVGPLRPREGHPQYAKDRVVFQGPIGGHQAIAHPLAQSHIEIEMARLMTQKAAALYDSGDEMARRRGRQHGQVRRRRGRLRRRRPGGADPRRLRRQPGVRHGGPAGGHPCGPDRTGSAAR